jgi:hypothetical protein
MDVKEEVVSVHGCLTLKQQYSRLFLVKTDSKTKNKIDHQPTWSGAYLLLKIHLPESVDTTQLSEGR